MFLGLNALRALSIVALILVLVSNVVTIVDDSKALKARKAEKTVVTANSTSSSSSMAASTTSTVSMAATTVPATPMVMVVTVGQGATSPTPTPHVITIAARAPSPSASVAASVAASEFEAPVLAKAATSASANTTEIKDEYLPNSTIPLQTAGAFWSILNRIFIIFMAILLVLAEIGYPDRLFITFIPTLGPSHGLGTLGVMQAFIAASVLSHHCSLFPQVSAWMLFVIGVFDALVGIFMREKAKSTRAIFRWERAEEKETKGPAGGYDWYADYQAKRSASPESNYSQPSVVPGAKFGGFAFGKAAEEDGIKISRPMPAH